MNVSHWEFFLICLHCFCPDKFSGRSLVGTIYIGKLPMFSKREKKKKNSENESHSVMSNSVRSHRLHCPWNTPGQNSRVGSCSLLQGIFPTQGSNPGLPHCRQILYQLSHKGSPAILEWVAYPFSRGSSQPRNWTGVSCIAGRFFTNWAITEVQEEKEGDLESEHRVSQTAWLNLSELRFHLCQKKAACRVGVKMCIDVNPRISLQSSRHCSCHCS